MDIQVGTVGGYAKLYFEQPDGTGTAMVLVEDEPGNPRVMALREFGFDGWGGAIQNAKGAIHAFVDEFVIIIGGGRLLVDATNPGAPEPWWRAVAANEDRALVVWVENGSVPHLRSQDGRALFDDLDRLRDRSATMWIDVTNTPSSLQS